MIKKFRRIEELLVFVQSLPISREQLERDLELSEKGDYTIASEVKGKAGFRVVVPDLTTPLGTVAIEAGVATVEGFGTAKISFESKFSDTPVLLVVPFGFFELKVPWVSIEQRQYTIGWWTITIPVPRITEMTIRLPSLCFMMNVDKDGFEVFNVIGRTTICYIAIGK